MRTMTGVAILAIAIGLNGPALAKKARHSYEPDQWSAQPAYERGPGVCRPLCVADVTPCDPPEFKNADGRCNLPGGSGRM